MCACHASAVSAVAFVVFGVLAVVAYRKRVRYKRVLTNKTNETLDYIQALSRLYVDHDHRTTLASTRNASVDCHLDQSRVGMELGESSTLQDDSFLYACESDDEPIGVVGVTRGVRAAASSCGEMLVEDDDEPIGGIGEGEESLRVALPFDSPFKILKKRRGRAPSSKKLLAKRAKMGSGRGKLRCVTTDDLCDNWQTLNKHGAGRQTVSSAVESPENSVVVLSALEQSIECTKGPFDVRVGREAESVVKPARNVGPQRIVDLDIRPSMIELFQDTVMTMGRENRRPAFPYAVSSSYSHPFSKLGGGATSGKNDPVSRKIYTLLQRQSYQAPSWSSYVPLLPGASSVDLQQSLVSCYRFNAVSNPMFQKKTTQATNIQSTRISTAQIQRAQNAAISGTELALGLSRMQCRSLGMNVSPSLPYSEHAMNPCGILVGSAADMCGVVVASTSLFCTSMPCKLKRYTLLDEAARIARMELVGKTISSITRCDVTKLHSLCTSVLEQDEAQYNSFWSSLALLSFSLTHPCTRELLYLDAFSVAYIHCLSKYACVEHTRRTNCVKRAMNDINNGHNAVSDINATIALAMSEYHSMCKTDCSEEELSNAKMHITSLEHRRVELLQTIDSAKCVRRRNGVSDNDGSNDEEYNARASFNDIPSDVLNRWIGMLGGQFIHVMCTLCSNKDDAELSTINNVQIQLNRIEMTCQSEEEREQRLTDVMWNMVQKIVSTMKSIVDIESNAPHLITDTLTRSLKFLRVDITGRPERVVAYTTKTSSFSSNSLSVDESSQAFRRRDLWLEDCTPLPDSQSLNEQQNILQRLATLHASFRISQPRQLGYDTTWSYLSNTLNAVYPVKHAAARSVLVFLMRLPKNALIQAAADSMTAEASAVMNDQATDSLPYKTSHVPSGCTPFISIGMRALSILISMNMRRLPNPVRLAFGVTLKGRAEREFSCEREHASPSPVAAIHEFQTEALRTSDDTHDVYSVAYHVSMSNATRLDDFFTPGAPIHRLQESMVLMSMGMVKLAFCSQVGSACMSDEVIAWWNNGQRIQPRIDCSSMLMLTVFNVYLGGRTNLVRSMVGTPWEGCYPSCLDPGVTPFGLGGRNYSDDRNPAMFYISSETSEEYARQFAKHSAIRTGLDQGQWDQRPPPTRGVPHGLIPGVHAALNPYVDALRSAHSLLSLPDNHQCELVVFPVSPYAQQLGCPIPSPEWHVDPLPPHIRHEYQSRAVNSDNTDPSVAIASSPRMMPPSQLYSSDNCFETGLEEIGCVVMAASYMAMLAKWLSIACESSKASNQFKVKLLHSLICRHLNDGVPTVNGTIPTFLDTERSKETFEFEWKPGFHSMAARAVMVLNLIYTSNQDIGLPVLHPDVAQTTGKCVHDDCPRSSVDVSAARRVLEWWSMFDCEDHSRCAWSNGVAKLILCLLNDDGNHSMHTSDFHATREALDCTIMSTYWVHSRNGTIAIPVSSPLHGITSPQQVNRSHVDGCFVLRERWRHRSSACGGIVGVKFFQMQQLFVLLESHGCASPPEIQIYRCGGQMLIRMSSDASDAPVAQESSRKKADKEKRYLCALLEKDIESQGTIQDRQKVCLQCRSAWDKNMINLLPIFLPIRTPLPDRERFSGDRLPGPVQSTMDSVTAPTTAYGSFLRNMAKACASKDNARSREVLTPSTTQ